MIGPGPSQRYHTGVGREKVLDVGSTACHRASRLLDLPVRSGEPALVLA